MPPAKGIMAQLTDQQKQERGQFLQLARNLGIPEDTILKWLSDPVKLRIINALVAATCPPARS